jgi:transcriptional regulator with PAS, ATPase and Fis domain
MINNDYFSAVYFNNNLETLEQIRKQKEDLIYRHVRPDGVNTVRREVIESWIRSYKHGHDIFKPERGPILPERKFQTLLREKEDLIKITDVYFQRMKPIFQNTSSILLLSDEQGVNLIDTYPETARDINLGEIGTEETVGTSAQAISIIKECPIQLSGPDHYYEDWNRSGASACPIFDFNHNLIGVLSVASRYECEQNRQTLGLVVATALSIQSELNLRVNHDLVNTSLEAADKGVVVLNNKGRIIRANIKAKELLAGNGRAINDEPIFGSQPVIQAALEKGTPMPDLDLEIEQHGVKFQLLSIQPIHSLNRIAGCVLFIKKADHARDGAAISGNTPLRYTFREILGDSPQILKSVNIAKKISKNDASILIQGESGTGKEVFAQAIHNESRPRGPYIPVNCAAIPKTLIESELFGYEGGSFTGAERKGKIGKIEMANGGTLFLDEIGDMPLEMQPVLLRVLEERNLTRVGGRHLIPVNFRLIAATNKDVLGLVQNNLFREDLYYRIATFTISIPPLRERETDILLLAEHFLKKARGKRQTPFPAISKAVAYQLRHYHWPGNIRQLENSIIYALHMSDGDVIDSEHLPEEIKFKGVRFSATIQRTPAGADMNRLSLREVEKMLIVEALLKNKNNICEVANVLGLSRTTLYRRIKEYGINI